MDTKSTLTRRSSLQMITTSLLAPFIAASRGEAAQAPAAVTPRRPDARSTTMGMINVGKENSTPIDSYYEDHGSGKPVAHSRVALSEPLGETDHCTSRGRPPGDHV
jgi:hypothetical protein